METKEYKLSLLINGRKLSRVIISQHYKVNHPEMSDPLILRLMSELNGQFFDVEEAKGDFEYFKAEPVVLEDKPYRVVFLLCVGEDFLGVVNAFRVRI